MRFDELNESNYMLFAIKFYDNPQSVTKEDFDNDLKRIRYIKRLLKRYKETGELKVHLILNHLIILFNVFNDATVPLLFYNLEIRAMFDEKTIPTSYMLPVLFFYLLKPLNNIK